MHAVALSSRGTSKVRVPSHEPLGLSKLYDRVQDTVSTQTIITFKTEGRKGNQNIGDGEVIRNHKVLFNHGDDERDKILRGDTGKQ